MNQETCFIGTRRRWQDIFHRHWESDGFAQEESHLLKGSGGNTESFSYIFYRKTSILGSFHFSLSSPEWLQCNLKTLPRQYPLTETPTLKRVRNSRNQWASTIRSRTRLFNPKIITIWGSSVIYAQSQVRLHFFNNWNAGHMSLMCPKFK